MGRSNIAGDRDRGPAHGADQQQRRRSADIRPLLLRSAAEEFAAKGYSSATVTEIAARAEVAPSVLYRHFNGKADIFKDAVVSPLIEALHEFREEWAGQRSEPYSDQQIWTLFIDDLYRSFAKHRTALVAYVSAADQLDSETKTEINSVMEFVFRGIREIAVEEAARRSASLNEEEIELVLHLVVTLVAGATTLGPLTLQLEDGPITPGRLITGMSSLTLWGITMGPQPESGRKKRPST